MPADRSHSDRRQHLERQAEEKRPYPYDDRDKRQLVRRASIPSQKGSVIVEVPDETEAEEEGLEPTVPLDSVDELRASLKVQATLARLGGVLGFKIWIAPGDRRKVGAQEGVNADLLLERLPVNYETATMSTIEQIDVIWIKGRSIVRAFEVEHTTAIFSLMYKLAKRWNVPGADRNPLAGLNLPNPNNERSRFLSSVEIQRLKAAVEASPNTQLKHIVVLLLLTGARKRELLDARWQNFDLDRRTWTVPLAKGGKARRVPFSNFGPCRGGTAVHMLSRTRGPSCPTLRSSTLGTPRAGGQAWRMYAFTIFATARRATW